jgi:TolA-binding protein
MTMVKRLIAGDIMRFHLLALVLMASAAVPAASAAAQNRPDSIDRRLERIEQQLRAVQRRVFPGGNAQFVEPEISGPAPAGPGGSASGDALSGLTARVDAIEAQLRTLTGQVEESGYRGRQLEAQIGQLRTELGARLDRIEAGGRPAETRPEPARAEPEPTPPRSTPSPAPAGPDSAEAAYNAGFRLWEGRRYEEAQAALGTAAERFPNTRWTSWMRNLQGRAYLDDNKPATAARILLANYQDNPEGERAADSLLYLGQALTQLDRRSEACRVLDELARVYPNMRSAVRSELPRARTAARC